MTEAPATVTHPETHTSEHDPELNTLGMWVFLAGEVMFFGALFTGYIVYRIIYPDAFAEGSQHLDVIIGSVNTALLLTSSFTMALAVNAAQLGKRKALIAFLIATILLGLGFLGLKALEYSHEFEQNLFPGGNFIYPGPEAPRVRLFFSLYFSMTGLHAVHMIIGLFLMAILVILAFLKKLSPENYAPVELTGLFWHFVDLVWIFLFPLLYLIRPA